MCTVTIFPSSGGIRMGCNRDESPLRPAALPPRLVDCGERKALMPIDPLSGGTWIAANNAGLIATVLNVYEAPFRPGSPAAAKSRGTIIPLLMECTTIKDAYEMALTLKPEDYSAFRLVIADRITVAELYWPGTSRIHRPPTRVAGPLLFTSSGLGDAVVDPPRRILFEETFGTGADWRDRQDAYHRHSWPDRRHVSVCMSRPNARTVSYTAIDLGMDRVTMTYYPVPPDQAAEVSESALVVVAK